VPLVPAYPNLRRAAAALARAAPICLAALLATADVAAAAKPPPDTVIDSGPGTLTNATSATFSFHSNQTPATFSCQVDGSAPLACTSPTTVSGLPAGAHTFAVTSTSSSGTDPSPATYTWTIDLIAPTAPASLAATTPNPTTVALTWKAGTDNIGVTNNVILRDGATLATVGNVNSYTDTTVLGGSTHTYTVEARDGAGNLSPASNQVTATTPAPPPAPDTVIDSGPAPLTNVTSATFTFHATVSGATYTCKLDAAKAGACTSPISYTRLAAGTHTFTVFATAGGVSDPSPAASTWTVDTTAPSAPTSLSAATSATSVTLSWAASTDNTGVVGYDVFRNGTKLAALGSVTTYVDSTVALGIVYMYSVDARDGAGNVSAQSAGVAARPMAAYDPHLTRAPYLTDLVGLNVAVNWATDQSQTAGSVSYGAVVNGACNPSTMVQAGRTTISVGAVLEYQWTSEITLPAAGTYCYRVFLGSTDLLGANPSPSFTTQVPFGSTQSFSFLVFGDWGQVDTTGQNPGQAALMGQIANSGARFAVSVGDNGYTNGSQINYGDLQQTGADTSAIFGPLFWTVPGGSIPLFTAAGNHGLSGVHHTDITTWTQAAAVSGSGGRYQNDVYCCINGTTASNYGSEWYAFSAGNARFYILDSAWGDLNAGTATPYQNDAMAHFAPGTPEYTWLLNDLNTHPTQLKFAFSHYPFYSDNATQPSDTFLEGPANLEGLLGQHGVQIVFNGHAHIYERNKPSAAGMPITYVTGGGGSTLEPVNGCSALDAYAIGWSPTGQHGSVCGKGVMPTSDAQVYHFLKVTVNGTSVTVTPTDSTGRTFDVQTFTFKVPTDTYLDSAPAAGTQSTSATFAFHASGSPATFKCQLDALTQTSCTSPITYSGLAQGKHTFKVAATYNSSTDPTPALASWTVDYTNPSAPSGLTAAATSPFSVNLAWTAATDNTGVTGYDVLRDGAVIATLGPVTSFADAVLGGSTHQYAVRARDVAGNLSPNSNAVSVTTAPPPPPVFSDGFESGNLSAWSTSGGMTVESTTVGSGSYAAEAGTTNGGTYAKKTLPATYVDAYSRVWFDVLAQPSQVNLLRLRDSTGASVGYVYVDTTGLLGFHNDSTGTNSVSGFSPGPGWHALELHVKTDPTAGVVEIWVDNTLITDLGGPGQNTGSTPIGSMQIGDTQSGRTYDVLYDNAAFGASRLGPAADSTPPTAPAGLAVTVAGPFEADLTWSASTDDVGVAGYDVYRDGSLIASPGNVLAYADTSTTAGSSHTYTVDATDASGNHSLPSTAVTVTQPPAALPLFADGFETGDTSAWTTVAGLTVENTAVHAGGYAAEGSTTTGSTYAKRSLGATYQDAYARVAFEVVSQASQVTLLRLRDTSTGTGGFVYLTSGGRLGFRSDAQLTGTTSSVAPGPGWHVLELHLFAAGASSSVGVWLDGAPVSDLSGPTDLGAVAGAGVLQIGDTSPGTWDVLFDDAGFGTSRLGSISDTTPPSVPANVSATATSAFSVVLTWDASTDDVGVTGYDVLRDGSVIAQASGSPYTDGTVFAGSTHQYSVRARDASGNVSPASTPVSVTLPAAPQPVFVDGFEAGDLSAWTTSAGLTVESADAGAGTYSAEGNTTTGATYAKEVLGSSYQDAYARVAFEVKSQASQLTLLRMRDSSTGNGGYVYLTSTGKLAFRADLQPAGVTSAVAPGPGWHLIELHLYVNGAASTVEVWLDGVAVPDLTFPTTDLGAAGSVTVLQIGETAPGGTWDVVFDNAAFGTGRLGAGDTTAPTTPANLTATATSAFSVQLAWDASTDDVGVTGYDVFRDGALFAQVTSPGYIDTTVLASSTHSYAVRARDASGNLSALTPAVPVTTPAAAAAVFAAGFETGDLSEWTTASGLAVETGDVHSGAYAAEGNSTGGTTYAKKTLPSSYQDAYARVAFEVKTIGAAQVTVLRLRGSAATTDAGYVYVTKGGKLGFHNDALATSTTSSAVAVAPGWHVVELHLFANGPASVVEVWLDGAAVPDLTFSATTLAAASIGSMQVGDTASSTVGWDIVIDDAAFGTSRLGVG
jgi:fibronectin type 3 domain-containing protein